jgi:hypothetical protein
MGYHSRAAFARAWREWAEIEKATGHGGSNAWFFVLGLADC